MAQREIKFKFWLGHSKKMTYEHSLSSFIEVFSGSTYFSDDIIPLQFTGLHDNNGKEIYEGDICSRNRHPEKYEIVFYKSGWAMKNETKDVIWREHFCNGANSKDLEVIGNIFENPELLK